MDLLLASGGYGSPERRTLLKQELQTFFAEQSSILLISYALHDQDTSLSAWQDIMGDTLTVESIHEKDNPITAIENAAGLVITGGNTFRLIHDLHNHQLIAPIRDRVHQGMRYFGVSAGSNVACPTMQTTNDMPIVQPSSFSALNLVPFQINAHYFSGHHFVKDNEQFVEHFGETRERRIEEFHQLNDTPVLGLEEAGMLRIVDQSITLKHAKARLFQANQAPSDYTPGDDLSHLLS